MKNILIVLVVLVVLGGGYVLMTSKNKLSVENAVPVSGETGVMEKVVTTDAAAAKEFAVDGFEFGYNLKTITVKKGDTVKITLTSSGKMPHDWVVDEFNARTKRIKAGESDVVTFVADKMGTFEYYCSVGQHRANGMVGKLIVE